MSAEPVRLEVKEDFVLEKFEGDVQNRDSLYEVIRLVDGEIVNHWRRDGESLGRQEER